MYTYFLYDMRITQSKPRYVHIPSFTGNSTCKFIVISKPQRNMVFISSNFTNNIRTMSTPTCNYVA